MNVDGRRTPWTRDGAPAVLASIFSLVFLLLPLIPIITACNEEKHYSNRPRYKRRFMSGSAMTGGSRSRTYTKKEYDDCLQRQMYRWAFYGAYVALWMIACTMTFIAYQTMRASQQSRTLKIVVGSVLPIAVVLGTGLAIGLTLESFN
ncbi:unnamed protein product, partial [Mesorhabditis belari]|uniref:Uncharacterized protein n=1 Tax=Mesorhabditis belari TaxID=2138241 RepID=A0AAF3F6B1_9BILA